MKIPRTSGRFFISFVNRNRTESNDIRDYNPTPQTSVDAEPIEAAAKRFDETHQLSHNYRGWFLISTT